MTNKNIYSFQENKDTSACTMNVKLENCLFIDTSDIHLNKKFSFVVRDKNCSYYFQAASTEERNEWVIQLRLALFNINNNGIDENEEYVDTRHYYSILDFGF